MEFETPPFIEVLEDRMRHPIYGYTMIQDGYWQSIIDWQKYMHDWDIKEEWMTFISGIVKGVGLSILHFTGKGDSVIIQPPVYHPFKRVIESNGRVVINNPLRWDGTRLHMDFDNLEDILKRRRCPLFILTSPHNLGGCMWIKNVNYFGFYLLQIQRYWGIG